MNLIDESFPKVNKVWIDVEILNFYKLNCALQEYFHVLVVIGNKKLGCK